MLAKLIRPVTNHGQRLFYRTYYEVDGRSTGGFFNGPFYTGLTKVTRNRFSLDDPYNALCEMRLYRFMIQSYERRCEELSEQERAKPGAFSDSILKDELRNSLFADVPRVTKQRVGRVLRTVVPYEISFQRNRSESTGGQNLMYWRWCHFLDIAYGIEHLMFLWLPKLTKISSQEDWDEEMEIIARAARPEEDYDLVDELRKETTGRSFRP